MVLLSALFYSLTIVRTPVYAKGTPAADLAAGKSLVMAGLGLAAAAASAAAQGQPLESLWPGYGDPASWGVLAWLAVGPGALAAFCQVQVRTRRLPAPSAAHAHASASKVLHGERRARRCQVEFLCGEPANCR